MNRYFFLAFFMLLSILAFSQKPESLVYRFKARDFSGKPLPGKELLLIVFLSEKNPDGKAVYQENHRVQTDAGAMVRIRIGDGTSSQNFSDLVIDPQTQYYLSVNGVDPTDDQTLFEQNVQVLILPTGIYAGSIEDLADSYFSESRGAELKAMYVKDGRLYLSNGGYVELPDFLCNCNSILVSANEMDVSCYGEEDGYIDLSVYGGTPPYAFSWSNGEETEDIYNLEAGEYSVYVSDLTGFTAVKKITVNQPDPLKVTAIVNNVSKIGKKDGAISLKLESGSPDTRFQWSNGARSKNLHGLSPGVYKVNIISGRNCYVEKEFTVKEPLDVKFTVKNVFCNGAQDGAVKVNVRGGRPPYKIIWPNNLQSDYVNKLPAGKYPLKIVDSWGYEQLDTVVVEEPPPIRLTADIGHPSIKFPDKGEIDIDLTGGTPPYTYQWSNSSTSEDLKGISAGVYSVLITDSRYCRMKQNNIIVYRTFKDKRDGREYKAIEIGDQLWMAENLNYGKQINSKQQPVRVGEIEKFCYDDNKENCDNLGGLYSWGEMMAYKRSDDGTIGTKQGACPDGWHVPTDKEWDELTLHLEEKGVAGDQLKNFMYWNQAFQGGSVETSGFSALPAGRMDNSGNFYYLGNSTTFWSATKESSDKAWHRTLTNRSGAFYKGNSHVSLRFSVRCIKDQAD